MVDRDIRGMNTSGLSHADLSLVEAGINSAVVGLGLSVLEVRFSSGTLRVTLDADPTPDLEIITEASKLISELLDLDLAERVAELRQNYELEVSSPGLERPLFNAEHFRRFAGRLVEIKTRSTNGSKTRVQGVIRSSDGSGVELEIEGTPERRRFDFDTIESAKTVFVWPQEKKPKNSRSKGTSRGSAKGNAAKAAEFKSSSGQVEEIDQDLEDELDDDLLSAEDQAMIGVEESIEDSTENDWLEGSDPADELDDDSDDDWFDDDDLEDEFEEEFEDDLEDELDDDLLSAEDQAMIGVEESIEDPFDNELVEESDTADEFAIKVSSAGEDGDFDEGDLADLEDEALRRLEELEGNRDVSKGPFG